MRNLFTLFFALPVCLPSFAQSKAISGIVTDTTGAPIPNASVSLARGGVTVAGTMTDDEGKFMVKVESGRYALTAEFIGYNKESRQVEVTGSRVDMGTIVLEESSISLGKALVSARQDAKKSSIEHTTINADADISGAKSSVLDILRSVPSVNIASDMSITVRGKSNSSNILLNFLPQQQIFSEPTNGKSIHQTASSCWITPVSTKAA